MDASTKDKIPMELRGIWVYLEHKNGRLAKVSRGVLSEGRRLADQMSQELVAVLLGYHLEKVEEIGKYGADRLLLIENPYLENYGSSAHSGVLVKLIQKHQPRVLLFGATREANDLASHLAARLKAGLVTNCNLLEVGEDGTLELTKPAYGGRVSATFRFPQNRLQLVTISSGVAEASTAGGKLDIARVDALEVDQPVTENIGFLKGNPETVDLSEAERIVAGGRGLGSPEGFELLRELASLLGASVGGTRVAVDNEWLPFERQIGQTGKAVSPQFLMTLGASGAMHYTMGFKEAEFVIAIDQNPRAPIFEVADVGVVADIRELLPALLGLLESSYQSEVT